MARTVSGQLNVHLRLLLQDTLGMAPAQGALDETYIKNVATGVGADQADRVYSERDKSLAAAYDLDLSGSLVDALGQAFVLVKAKCLLVIAADANTNTVVVGGDANGALIGFGAAAHTIAVRPGGVLLLYAPDATGYAITAGTGDILQFAPGAGTQLCSFAISGTSA